MVKIRPSTFETNSSSTHSLVVLKKRDWEAVKRGELFIDVTDTGDCSCSPRLVTENLLMAEAREEYLEEERNLGSRECHESFKDGHYVSWEELMESFKGDYRGYDLNIFGWAGEQYINPKSQVWEHHTEKELDNGRVQIEIDHFFG